MMKTKTKTKAKARAKTRAKAKARTVDDVLKARAAAVRGKAKARALERSAGHVCWAARVGPEGQWRAIDDRDVRRLDGFVEFFTSACGRFMCRAPVIAQVTPTSEIRDQLNGMTFDGPVRSGFALTQVGPRETADACRRLGAEVPALTDAAARRQEERLEMSKTKSKATQATSGEATKREVGRTSGVGLAETWSALLVENEKASKANRLTDDQLVRRMEAEFPSKKGKSTLTRVSMIRGCFNKGTNLFASVGPAEKRGLPRSQAYDKNGDAKKRGGGTAGKAKGKAMGKPASPSSKKGKAKGKAKGKKTLKRAKPADKPRDTSRSSQPASEGA